MISGSETQLVITLSPEIRQMGKYDKLLNKILDGRADAAIRFGDVRRLLLRLGFVERTRGSHHLFHHSEVGVRINLQAAGAMAKPYQIRQVRAAIMKLHQGSPD